MTTCPRCKRSDCPTLSIPDPRECAHKGKHWTNTYACHACLTAFEEARWPAKADCENAQRSAQDWAGMWSIANDRANAAEAKVAAVRETLHHWRCVEHALWCATRADCPCDCGADETNAARQRARKAAGLED